MNWSAPRAFDGLAAQYDATFTGSVLGRALRELVWLRMDECLGGCQRVLELGCGTAEDAVRLASRGVHVVATDVSPAMIAVARRKTLAAGCAPQVEFHCVAMEDLASAAAVQRGPFQGVLSNFGALNCIRDLPGLIRELPRWLAPGARLLWVVMGRHVPWEWMWYLPRGQWRRAWRRLTPGGVRWRDLNISYPTPAAMARILTGTFTIDRVSPLGIALPPSYAGPWLERSPRAFGLLRRLEILARDCTAGGRRGVPQHERAGQPWTLTPAPA
jgi:SAM-dependent methyltransferase